MEGKFGKMEEIPQNMEFGVTYKCSFVGFAIEGEGNGEGDCLRCPIIEFGVGFVPLVWSIGIEQGSCGKIRIWENQDLGSAPKFPPNYMDFGHQIWGSRGSHGCLKMNVSSPGFSW